LPILANFFLMLISLTHFNSIGDGIFLYVNFCHKSIIKI
jgi:hypothetical protein